ncbi:MAG: LysR family transcriptional regulator [Gammaproteobacteria bacterium (ex Lamellibrachia satsuma)]|nr:MAG: transcriptional activator NhaR [Gammaproteobacteria bacterium (ex Lamellibrachia satsuma)]RRS31013.1 MAG: LysR family transcriptional regulator [Gammaproteobacteria bacterium (ex Lamellibrachia satsuma)]RRS36026.1 MAG: LysR family transcriptional regulator [Gammaproteobacteria bacterium (ex Lamellibrachia satsuma)]
MINYKHLHYFWMVAKEGSIARACERLHLTPQTISGQLSLLEESLGEPLFNRVGRSLELTETGRQVQAYANEIFSLGMELEELIRNFPSSRPLVFKVGVADVVPKSIAYRLLAPSLEMSQPVRIICRENTLDALLADLAVHRVDLVIADGPVPASAKVRGFNHHLGECGISFLAVPQQAKKLRKDFPRSLDGAPMLLPGEMTAIHGELLKWFEEQQVNPRIVGEFDDSALMKAFGQAGAGVFIAPTPISSEVEKQYGVEVIGQTEQVQKQFYAISVERKISHPAVAAITETAREWLVLGDSAVQR